MKSQILALVAGGAVVVAAGCVANSAEIKLLHPSALRSSTEVLLPGFTQSSGHVVKTEFGAVGA